MDPNEGTASAALDPSVGLNELRSRNGRFEGEKNVPVGKIAALKKMATSRRPSSPISPRRASWPAKRFRIPSTGPGLMFST
jgi:hypothetical protein